MSYGSYVTCLVFRQTGTAAHYWARNRLISNQSLAQSFSGTAMSFSGNSTWGVKNSTNVARPAFNDVIYWANITNLNLIGAGWANRPYTDTECNDLVEYLDENYGGG